MTDGAGELFPENVIPIPRNWSSDISTTDGAGESFFPKPTVFGIRSSRVLGRKSFVSKRFPRWISRRPGPFAPDEAFRQSISGFRHPRAAERRPHVRSWFPRNWSSDISTTDGAGESFFPKPLTGQGAFFFWSETPRPPLFGGKAENGDPLYIKGNSAV